jgi:excisionase family DNA binding protein
VETQSEQHELLTVDETIRFLRLGRTRVNEILRSGDLVGYKLGRRRLVRRSDISAWLEHHKAVPSEE